MFLSTETDTEKNARYFDTSHLQDNLAGRSVRGGTVTAVVQGGKLLLTIVSAVVLARLLAPGDYGLVAMVTSVTGFVNMFGEFGLSMATIQKEEITHPQVSTLFWVNVSAGGLLMIVTSCLSPLVAWFYNEPRLITLTVALSVGFLFSGLAVQHQSILRRQMRFTSLAVAEIVSMVTGTAVAIGCALSGVGYWSLVVQQLTAGLVAAVIVWIFCGWRPGFPVRHSGVRSLIAFGGNLTGFNIVNYFARNLDNILIGWFWGARELGLYSRAYSLLMLPLNQINAPISAVAVPTLSRLQDQPERFKCYYLKGISVVSFITFPLIFFLIVMSQEVTEVLLGVQWKEAGKIFRYLAIAAVFQPLCNSTGWIYVALGKTSRMLRWGVFASVVIVISFFAGITHGSLGVSAAYSIAILLLVVPCIVYAVASTQISPREVLTQVAPSFLLSLASAIMAGVVSYLLPGSIPLFTKVAMTFAVMAGCYLIVSLKKGGMVSDLRTMFSMRKTV